MKNLSILAFILMLSLSCFAQKKVGGFYKGTLFNDSTKMVQQYELALAEYRGKIMGYAYVTFVANDTFYYGIRKIKAKIVGDNLIVEDDKMIGNNFPESPAKHVNRTITIPFNGQDSLVSVNGRWKTNQTKIYYAVPGSVEASKSNDSSGSALFAHLKELNLMPNENNYVATETKSKEKDNKVKVKEEQDQPTVAKTKIKSKEDKIKTERKTDTAETEVKVKEDKTKIEPDKVASKTVVSKNNVPAVLNYAERKDHLQQTVEIASDSLFLSFYDNGVVDGDSISVYLNNQPVISNTTLTSVATKKTIYVGGMNEVKLLLVAENLGTIPPNTGLLVIRDGDKTYQVN
ncbi:MAG TPA: hypothetical protein VL095_15965, partial [Flavisolibacter sp.]|nr:hypothetical protein [Flavisolibacter sp.]